MIGTLFVAAISFVPFGQQEYTAILEHTAGIRVGEEVQVAGVGSGEVRGIELDGHQVRVTFTLDQDVQLGRSTTASVKVATLLGSHFLEVEPAGTGSLPDDTIALSRTSVPFNLQDVIEGAHGELEDLDTKTVSRSRSRSWPTRCATPRRRPARRSTAWRGCPRWRRDARAR